MRTYVVESRGGGHLRCDYFRTDNEAEVEKIGLAIARIVEANNDRMFVYSYVGTYPYDRMISERHAPYYKDAQDVWDRMSKQP